MPAFNGSEIQPMRRRLAMPSRIVITAAKMKAVNHLRIAPPPKKACRDVVR
jgi:hypothetical protein